MGRLVCIFKTCFNSLVDSEPPQTEVVAQIAQEIYSSHLLLIMIQNLAKVDFEVRVALHTQHI